MEGIDGSEVDAVREVLERAKKAAQSPLVETQIRDCEQFLVRARAHLEALQSALDYKKISCFSVSMINEMQQWVWDRQRDLQAATMAGRPEDAGRISQLIIQGPQEWHGIQSSQTNHGRVRILYVAFHGGSHGSMIGQQFGCPIAAARRRHLCVRDVLYGLSREASHPDPRRRRVRSSSVECS